MEERIFIPVDNLNLEAALNRADPEKAGIIAHPHPLYGGNMDNNVVIDAADALNQAGYSSLRFNFRGVGRSDGQYGHGRAEQDDLAAAVEYMKGLGANKPVIIGYSFGAWVAAFAWRRLRELGSAPLILIAPPAALMNFDDLDPETEIDLIICGQQDDLAPPQLAENLGRKLSRPVEPVVLPIPTTFSEEKAET